MTMKLYISPNYSAHDEYITISKSGFFFSAEFIDKNKLTTNEYCQFFTSSERVRQIAEAQFNEFQKIIKKNKKNLEI